jgi:hypothetical protein
MLRPDKKYSEVEAKVLDASLVLHMEHGGGIIPPLPPGSLLPLELIPTPSSLLPYHP